MKIKTESTWDTDAKMPAFAPLKTSLEVEVAIIGGGITGLTCAYLLSKAGKKVALLEKNALCFGATGVTTAFLTQNIDTSLRKLVKIYGKRKAKLITMSHQQAIDSVEKIIKENKIDCEFIRCSNYSYATNKNASEELQEEEKVGQNLGISMKFKEDSKLNFQNWGYLELANQAKFHPLKYLSSLSKIASNNGAHIFEHTEVENIEGKGPYALRTPGGKVRAQYVIIATHAPFNKKLYFKKIFYDSYVIEAQITPKVLLEGIYEDTLNPYHYFRVDRKGKYDRLIIGGEDHRSDIPVEDSKNFQALLDYIQNTFSNLNYKTIRKWEGPILESVDGLAYIGSQKDKKIFYATGFSGNGITYSNIAARIIVNAILRKKDRQLHQFASLYSADRKLTLKQFVGKGNDYARELIRGAIKNSLKYKKKDI